MWQNSRSKVLFILAILTLFGIALGIKSILINLNGIHVKASISAINTLYNAKNKELKYQIKFHYKVKEKVYETNKIFSRTKTKKLFKCEKSDPTSCENGETEFDLIYSKWFPGITEIIIEN